MKVWWFTDNEDERLLLSSTATTSSAEIVAEDDDLTKRPAASLLIINANAGKNERSNRLGLKWLKKVRREYYLTIPAVVYSFESLEALSAEYSILNTKGVRFVRLPVSKSDFTQLVEESRSVIISEYELTDIVSRHCDLYEEWRSVAHKLGNDLAKYREKTKEIKCAFEKWAVSINRFAPDQKDNLENFGSLLRLPPDSVNTSDLKRALEKLDDGLQSAPSVADDEVTSENYTLPPSRPPKGFSRVLIADDESQDFLINSLRYQYGYDVIEQAKKLSQAKDLLDKEKPDVVLSDYYFKESSRSTELPDKSIGDRFIHYSLSHPQYADTDPKKPIVLVTSKATLRSEAEIRSGAINCSGANRATDPIFIHGVIWAEARKRGVCEPEEISGQEWTLEHTCRLRLEQYEEDLPKLIKQWNEFKNTVRDTLRLCRLLSQSTSNDAPEIIQQVISVLEPYETENDFSFGVVSNIFAEIEKVHKSARTHPDSQAKQAIRNILHGRIEQFSSVTNAVKFLTTTLTMVERDLTSLHQHQHLGQQLKSILRGYSETELLLPFLILLNENLAELLSILPKLPSPPAPPKNRRDVSGSNNINIVLVEDNEFWRDFVISAIEKTKSRLGENFTINYQHFDNAADALAAIPSSSKSFAIDGSDQDNAKTIAIVDICLPENQDHSESIRAALEGRSLHLNTPHSTHGLNLIRNLCSYNYNIPLIIFSTIDSLDDRRTIGSWGVSDDDFLAKGIDDENTIVRALVRKIEKRTKYVIKRFEDESGNSRFWINGIGVPFTNELGETFSAIYSLCQETGTSEFSISEIVEARGDSVSEESKKAIQDQIYRIRNLILTTLQTNRVFVNVRELIKTRKSHDDDEFTYQINAEIIPLEEEDDHKTDLQIYENEICKVLVVENNPQTLSQIIEPLRSSKYEVVYATNVEDAVQAAIDFLPHVISLDLQIPYTRAESESSEVIGDEFAGLEAWRQIRVALRASSIGIVVPTVNTDKNYLVSKAAQMEIPIRNFISKHEPNWLNLFLKKVADERRKVFLGEITDANQDINEPIVEILDGSDLPEGVLRLVVNSEPFTIKKSPLAKTIGLLLSNPKTLQSFETIKKSIGSKKPVTENDAKNWTKRIRAEIKKSWLKSVEDADLKALAEKILESSSKGLRLNVQVIDSREKGN